MGSAKKRGRIGGTLDDFLAEEGLLAEATAASIKRVLAWQIAQAMHSGNISKAEMARQMKTSRAALERLLDPHNASVTLKTMHRAARVLGKRIELSLVD